MRLLEVPFQSHGVVKKFGVLELSLHVQHEVHSQIFGLQRQLHFAGLSTLGAAYLQNSLKLIHRTQMMNTKICLHD
jgi:hypothetical protein